MKRDFIRPILTSVSNSPKALSRAKSNLSEIVFAFFLLSFNLSFD